MNTADSIVVSGHTSDAGVVTTVLFRLLSDGQFHTSFGQGNIHHSVLLPFVAEAYDVALPAMDDIRQEQRSILSAQDFCLAAHGINRTRTEV